MTQSFAPRNGYMFTIHSLPCGKATQNTTRTEQTTSSSFDPLIRMHLTRRPTRSGGVLAVLQRLSLLSLFSPPANGGGGAVSAAFVTLRGTTQQRPRNLVAGSSFPSSLRLFQNTESDLSPSSLYTPRPGSLVNQTIVITGATSGLGLESARRLASAGANVILTARSASKGQAAVQIVRDHVSAAGAATQYPNQKISFQVLDLDDLSTIRNSFASTTPANSENEDSSWNDVGTIDVLINNAGIMALPKREITVDGFERQVQSNHLGHFLLTALLSPQFSRTCKIITVSSTAHTLCAPSGLRFDYFWQATPTDSYGAWRSYGQSKLANILFTQELQRRIDESPVLQWKAMTLHPGVVATDLGRYMMGDGGRLEQRIDDQTKVNSNNNGVGAMIRTTMTNFLLKGVAAFLKTPQQGATTQIWLASGGADKEPDCGGKYYVDCQEQPLRSTFATDRAAAQQLWQESEERVGVSFELPTTRTETTAAASKQLETAILP